MKIRSHPIYKGELVQVINKSNVDWNILRNKTIMVIGGTGLIGQGIVDLVLACNATLDIECRVIVTGRSSTKARRTFGEDIWLNHNFSFVEYDVANELAISNDEKIDFLVYAASNTHPVAYASNPVGTILTNIIGLNNALKFAVEENVKKVVFLSSVEIYGENLGKDMFSEASLGYIDSNTLRAGYPESKRTGEALCQAFLAKYPIDITIARLSRVYGSTVLATDSKASTQFIKRAINGKDIVLKSDGSQLFSYTYTPDAVSAILFLIQSGESGHAYNIKSVESDITLKELAEYLASLVDRKVVYELPDSIEASGFSKATVATLDNSKIVGLGWKSVFSMYEGIFNTVSILRDTDNDLRDKDESLSM